MKKRKAGGGDAPHDEHLRMRSDEPEKAVDLVREPRAGYGASLAPPVEGTAFRDLKSRTYGGLQPLVKRNTMKTTLMLDADLIAAFKIRAAKAGTSLSHMVIEAMRFYEAGGHGPLGSEASSPSIRPLEAWVLPVLGGSGEGANEYANVNFSSNADLEDFLGHRDS